MNKRSRQLLIVLSIAIFGISATWNVAFDLEKKIIQLKKEKKLSAFHPEISNSKNKAVSPEEIKLGKQLFNDVTLSRNRNISCANCHIADSGFGNNERFGIGTHGNKTKRNVPHLYNLSLNKFFFWDGRASTLEEQLSKVITSPDELDMTFKEVEERLKGNNQYVQLFDSLYPGKGITKSTITQAIVTYEKSILSYKSAFDNYLDGDTNALTNLQKKGLELFVTKANCIACHNGANLSDGKFHNVGVVTDDLGRHLIDKVGMMNEFESTPYPFFSNFKAFKTPTLRNIKNTAPYFHDGSKKTLKEVLLAYNKGGETTDPTGLAKEIHPLNLDESEMEALISFLESLNSSNY